MGHLRCVFTEAVLMKRRCVGWLSRPDSPNNISLQPNRYGFGREGTHFAVWRVLPALKRGTTDGIYENECSKL
jgi:hypothetical protein